jgi:hypothetical protein
MRSSATPPDLDGLAAIPSLRDHWVAIDSRGRARAHETPLCLPLASGAVVVDADQELESLCRRIKDEGRTALTILFSARRS